MRTSARRRRRSTPPRRASHWSSASYGNLVDQLGGIDRQLRGAPGEERRRQTALTERKALLADRIREAYSADRVTLLEDVLSADSFTDALSQVGYLLDIGIQDEALAREIVDDIRELSAIQQEVHGTSADIEVLREEMTDRKVELDVQLGELKVARDKLAGLRKKAAAALAVQRSEYDELAQDTRRARVGDRRSSKAREDLTNEIDDRRPEEARAGAADSRGPCEGGPGARGAGTGAGGACRTRARGTAARSRGARERDAVGRRQHPEPLQRHRSMWPMGGYVTQEFGCTGFGWEPPLGRLLAFPLGHRHRGAVRVVDSRGRVRARWCTWAGTTPTAADPAWIVIIAHADNLQTWYGHLQARTLVQAGPSVGRGQMIGYEGNTGHSTGPHLHWMVRLNGSFVNPSLFV